MINITDLPIAKDDEDQLEIEDYKNALLEYIQNSKTPMTISIQGEWGSGKTSLMNMIQSKLSSKKFPIIWINTWEYSIISEELATLSVFHSIIEKFSSLVSDSSDKVSEKYNKQIAIVKKSAEGVFKGAAKLLLSMNLDVNSNSAVDDVTKTLEGASSIGALKRELQKLVKRILELNNNELSNNKIVLFIDDLDRLNPEVAIKILEILKNVFDLEDCLFVLAIDYDVIVKGLNTKFGDRDVNEREYRQFFDKIIQLPFALPVGRYNSEKYLKDMIAGDKIDYFTKEEFDSNKEYLMKIANFSVGGNPRALKRMANYLSLVKYLAKNSSLDERLVHFTLIAIQIVYPFVYQMLAKEPDFANWNDESFKQTNFELPKELKENEAFNEEWEVEIYKAIKATKNSYFLERSFDISLLLNAMIDKFEEENIGSIIDKTLKIASITNAEPSRNEDKNKRDFTDNWKELKKDISILKIGTSNSQTITLGKGYKIKLNINQFSTKITLLVKMNTSNRKWAQLLKEAEDIPDLAIKDARQNKKFIFTLDGGFENFDETIPEIIRHFFKLKELAENN